MTRISPLVLLLALVAPTAATAQEDRLASAGRAAFTRAAHYENGESVRKNLGRARALYCQAARQGDPHAYLNLAWIFINGRGVQRDDRAAVYWLKKAAAQGVPQAVNLLRVMPGVSGVDRGCSSASFAVYRHSYPGIYVPATGAAPPSQYRDAIEQAAQDAGISATLLASIVTIESGYDAGAVSDKGAMGLTQLMPATAARFGVHNAFDYRENLRGGATYMRALLDQFGGDVGLALAAYNAGEGAVDSYRGIPPYAETQAYVRAVMQLCDCAVRAAGP